MAKWSVPIDRYVKAAKGDLNKAARAVGLELYSRIMVRSPVDTGRFRGNWMIGVSVDPASLDPNAFDKTGAAGLSTAPGKLASYRLGETIYIMNNLPYAVALEYGHSTQAPAGVVRVTVAEFRGIVSKSVRKAQAADASR